MKRNTITRHGLPTKEHAWDRWLDASLENYLGKELLASGQLNESNQFTPGMAQGVLGDILLSSSRTSWGCALLLSGHKECQHLQWGTVSVTPLLRDPNPTPWRDDGTSVAPELLLGC